MLTLTGFTDEALTTLAGQARMAAGGGLTHVELRRHGVRPVATWSDDVADRVERRLAAAGLRASCIATGLGKTGLDLPLAPQLDQLRRACALAHRFGTPFVRVFSWFTTTPDADRAAVLRQMAAFAEVGRTEGVQLVHENEKGVFGDTPERCRELAEACGVRLIFDPANYVQLGVAPVGQAWPLVGEHVAYVHAKDARAATGRVTAVGAGDGEWAALVATLRSTGWSGFVSLEPHLGLGGRGGPITPRRWLSALATLRATIAA